MYMDISIKWHTDGKGPAIYLQDNVTMHTISSWKFEVTTDYPEFQYDTMFDAHRYIVWCNSVKALWCYVQLYNNSSLVPT